MTSSRSGFVADGARRLDDALKAQQSQRGLRRDWQSRFNAWLERRRFASRKALY
jgi:hypothetical protein